MKTEILCTALLFAASAFAQQPAEPPVGPLPQPHNQPPLAPGNQVPGPMPPDTNAPAASPLTYTEAQKQIETKLADEPGLAGANVSVTVDDHGVFLNGMVDTQQQHDLALRIARSYSGDRPIDDKIQIRGKA